MLGFKKKTIVVISALLLLFFLAGTLAVLYPIYQKSKSAFASFDALLESDPETAFTYMDDIKFITIRTKLSKRLHAYRYKVAKEYWAAGRYTEAFESASFIGNVDLLRDFQNEVIQMYLAEQDAMTKTFLRRYLIHSEYQKTANETDPYIPYRPLGAVGQGFALSVQPDGTLAVYGEPPEGLLDVIPHWGPVAAVSAFEHSVVATTISEKEARAVAFGQNDRLQLAVGSVNRAVSPSLSETHSAVTIASGGCFVTNQQSTARWAVSLAVAGNNYTAGVNWYGRPLVTGNETLAELVQDWTEIVLLAAGGDALYGLTVNGVLHAAQSPFDVDGMDGIVDVSAAPGKLMVLDQNGKAIPFGYAPSVSEALEKLSDLAAVYAGVDGVLVRSESGQYHYIQE